MDRADPSAVAAAWRDRLAARAPWRRADAEAAIRRAYEASGLAGPAHIVWTRGPRELAQAIAFATNPPCARRWSLLRAPALAAIGWTALAAMLTGDSVRDLPFENALLFSVILAGLAFSTGALARIPVPPGFAQPRRAGLTLALGAAVVIALACHGLYLLRPAGFSMGSLGRAADIVLAALVGLLPGVFLRWRMHNAYAGLPPALRRLARTPTVVGQLEQARASAWSPFCAVASGPRPSEALLNAYRMVHSLAFAWAEPRHLDGLIDAPRAAGAHRIAASGAAAAFADLAFRVDRLYAYAAVAVAAEPPTMLRLDADGRPHGEDGPALAWADATTIHAWRGRLVPPDLIDPVRPVTLERIRGEWNAGRRRVLIERYGLGRYLLEAGAAEIHRDGFGRLYRLTQRLEEPICAVRVVNRTAEADGTFREFWLRVPPNMTTARQAVAWTFGLAPEEYTPRLES